MVAFSAQNNVDSDTIDALVMIIIKAVHDPYANEELDFKKRLLGLLMEITEPHSHGNRTIYIKSLVSGDRTATLKLDQDCVLLYLTTRV